jgi:hypothetical protein
MYRPISLLVLVLAAILGTLPALVVRDARAATARPPALVGMFRLLTFLTSMQWSTCRSWSLPRARLTGQVEVD